VARERAFEFMQSGMTGRQASSTMVTRGGQELPYLGYMLTHLADSLHQFVRGAFEFLAPVLQLDRVNHIHPAWIERLEA
jgi:hypothetical protein